MATAPFPDDPLKDVFVSVVCPLHNDAPYLAAFVGEVAAVLSRNYRNHELLLVDDGSEDATPALVAEALSRHPCVRYIRLSRRFGDEIAITSGLESAIGDYVVVMMPDSDPPSLIPDIVEVARSGAGVVVGIRRNRSRQPWWMRLGAALFYLGARRFLRLTVPTNATQFRVLSRQAVNAIARIKDKYRYLRLLSSYVGFSSHTFVYDPVWRTERPRARGFWESVNLAIGIVVSHSTHPLRVVSFLGLGAGTLNLLYMAYVVAIYLLQPQVARGWTTLSLQASVMFFFLFLILAVVSEYIGRILEEAKIRPLYYVLEERNSNVLVADSRTNIVRDSVPADGAPHA